MKLAVVNSSLNNFTTATYFIDALNELKIESQIFHPKEQRNIPPEFEILLFVDDGTEYVIDPRIKQIKILYIIDTHMGIKDDLSMIRFVDYVFCAQKNAVDFIKKYNTNVEWLPLACDFKFHSNRNLPIIYDVAFIGAFGSGKRKHRLELVKQNFENSYFGPAEKTEIGKIYGQSKIVFNASINNDINMRFFEGMCSGALLITDKIFDNGLENLQDQMHDKFFITYANDAEMIDCIKFFLDSKNQVERKQIANKGNEFALQNTYQHRVKHILKVTKDLEIKKPKVIEYYLSSLKLFFKKVVRKICLKK